MRSQVRIAAVNGLQEIEMQNRNDISKRNGEHGPISRFEGEYGVARPAHGFGGILQMAGEFDGLDTVHCVDLLEFCSLEQIKNTLASL